tara:strand:+ start:1548 stop:1931 length:384 start_codon:yes stop_codon:yes gene_type:complete
MIQIYIKALKQYVNFKTRSTIREFWLFNFLSLLIGLIFIIIDKSVYFKFAGNIGTLTTLYSIFIFIPSLSISVRRLHDVGKSGWTILFIIVPIIGIIWLLALFCRDTMPEKNKWGENPTLRGFHRST